MARVKAAMDLRNFEDNDTGRKQVVQSALDEIRFMTNGNGDFDVCDLTKSVDAGISSAGALHFDVASKDVSRRLSKFAHHSAGIFLILPAAVARAVIFQQDFERGHPFAMARWEEALAALRPVRTHNPA